MTLADKTTLLRVILAPLFFVVYFLPSWIPAWFPGGAAWTVPVLWVLFIVSEISDMVDGLLARKRNEVSDFGKLFDPFADTLVQLTYFLCFVLDRLMPVPLFLVVLYREYSILFVRNLMLKKGIAMGARMGGKIKTVAYIGAASLALLASSSLRLGLAPVFHTVFSRAALALFMLSVLLAVLSFADYLKVYRKESSAKPD
jgi:CDP-diacylglycerol--glycerol-3-phosphate 3-phosphatidyltransferase